MPAAVVGCQPGGVQVELGGQALPAGGVHARCRRRSSCRSPASVSVVDGADLHAGDGLRRTGTSPPRSRRWYCSASTISVSQNSSIALALLDHGDLACRARRTSRRTRCRSRRRRPRPSSGARLSRPRMPSESMIVLARRSRRAIGRAGVVPVAMTMLVGRDRGCSAPLSLSTTMVCGSTKRPCPVQQVDVVAGELVADDVDLAADHVLRCGRCRSAIVISSLTR